MYHYALIGYMLWKYAYVLEYTYSAVCYSNTIRHYIFDKKEENEDWVLLEIKDPSVIIEEIELP
jgi:hypothetical protein